MKLNVTSQESVDQLISAIKERFGAVTILVNNAAITQDNLLMRMKDEEWMQVIETNLSSVFRLTKTCIRDMLKARWGRIINIGSVVGSTGNAGQANYAAAKAGVIGFGKAMALEVGSREITVNAVSQVYLYRYDGCAHRGAARGDFPAYPYARLGTVNDIAAAVLFLASPEAGYITGQTLHVNGGNGYELIRLAFYLYISFSTALYIFILNCFY